MTDETVDQTDNEDKSVFDLQNIPDDISWLRASFLISEKDLTEEASIYRKYCSAEDKFQNTSLGGNFAINIPPQFTHTADPNIRGFGSPENSLEEGITLPPRADNVGLGRYFSDAIDDNKEVIHMRFGVPEFSSMAAFFLNSYDSNLAKLAKTGQASKSFVELLGTTIGTIAGFVVALPVATFIGAIRLGNFVAKLMGSGFYLPNTKYYYIKPTMRLYWKAVNYMTNALAVNLAILPSYIWAEEGREGGVTKIDDKTFTFLNTDKGTKDSILSKKMIEELHQTLPDIFRKEGGIDVRSVANKAKRLEIRRRERLVEIMETFEKNGETVATIDELKKLVNESVSLYKMEIDNLEPESWFMEYLNSGMAKLSEVFTDAGYVEEGSEGSEVEEGEIETPNNNEDIFGQVMSTASSVVNEWLLDANGKPSDSAMNYMKAEMLSGSDWVTFKVVGEKTVSESFSNEVGPSAVSEKINSMAGSVRDLAFNLAGGDIGIPGLQSILNLAITTINSTVGTAAKMVGMDGLGVLLGGGFIDMPNVWKNSTANLPKIEYTLELRATYGNKISVFTDIYVPLAMLLSGTLPLSTGKRSYTSPFLVEVYRKGRSQVRLGIVESLNITRGVGNAGWTVDDLPLGVDVTLSIVDLSQIMHMPIDDRLGGYDDDSAYSDYMATLGSLGLSDMTMWYRVAQRAKAKFQYDWHNLLFESKSTMSALMSNIGVNALGTNFTIKDFIQTFDIMDAQNTTGRE